MQLLYLCHYLYLAESCIIIWIFYPTLTNLSLLAQKEGSLSPSSPSTLAQLKAMLLSNFLSHPYDFGAFECKN